jgi:tetratricopeptide (TPR) repeat protein
VAEAADPLTAGDRFFERPELELDNLRAALATALHADPPLALRIAGALFQFWITRGYFTEASRLLDAALAAAPERTPLRAGALEVAAALEVRRARRDFVRLAQESAGIHEELGDRRALAATLLHIGTLEWLRSDHAAAQARLAQALALAEEVGDAAVVAAACHVQGIDAYSRGDDPGARRRIAESLDRLAGSRDETAPAMWAMTIGLAYDDDGRGHPRAYFEDTWLMYRTIGPEAAEGYVLCSLAAVARSQRDYDSARESLDRSLALFRELDDGFGTGVALNALGNLARSRDQIELGREWLEEALVVRRALGDRRSTAMTLGNLGLLEGRAGDVERGREHLGRSLAILRETEDVAGMGAETLNLAYLELEAGEPERARPLLERGERLFGGRHSQHLVAWARAALAEILLRSPGLSAAGPHEAAREALERARVLFSEIEDVRGLAHVQALEAELLGAASPEPAG